MGGEWLLWVPGGPRGRLLQIMGSYSPLHSLGNLWKLVSLLQASVSSSVKWEQYLDFIRLLGTIRKHTEPGGVYVFINVPLSSPFFLFPGEQSPSLEVVREASQRRCFRAGPQKRAEAICGERGKGRGPEAGR